MTIPPKPELIGLHSQAHSVLDERVLRGNGLLIAGAGIKISTNEYGQYVIVSTSKSIGVYGGYQGEYDPTKSYSVSQEFKISVALTIAGHVIPTAIWAVRPASSVVDAQGFGPWAGYLPANPATSGINMANLFFDPAHPPTLGAAPNDKLYAELKTPLC